MLTVEDYGVIRRAHRDGMSIRAIARTFHHSRRNVREALASPEPQPYTRAKEADAPKLGAFKATIDQILAADDLAPPKQRHRAIQVFRRLRDEQGYAGGYDQVRRYIRSYSVEVWGREPRNICHADHKRPFVAAALRQLLPDSRDLAIPSRPENDAEPARREGVHLVVLDSNPFGVRLSR
jgi:hypothetical protein